MSKLAEKKVPEGEPLGIHVEQKMKKGIENAPGVFRRAKIGGFKGDYRQPNRRRQPDLDDSPSRGSQWLTFLAIRGQLEPR